MTATPVYRLTLGKTYYDKGFFNLGVEVERFIRTSNGPIKLKLGESGRTLEATVNRDANQNGTPRVMGGAELRNWFQWKYKEGDMVDVHVLSPEELWIK